MIAFLLDRDPPTASEQISDAIRTVVGRDEPLMGDPALATLESVYRSAHGADIGSIMLVHLLLDMTRRGASFSERA